MCTSCLLYMVIAGNAYIVLQGWNKDKKIFLQATFKAFRFRPWDGFDRTIRYFWANYKLVHLKCVVNEACWQFGTSKRWSSVFLIIKERKTIIPAMVYSQLKEFSWSLAGKKASWFLLLSPAMFFFILRFYSHFNPKILVLMYLDKGILKSNFSLKL